jgi:hypothetical protein
MINNFEDKIFAIVLLPLMALMAPFLVFLIELFLPYPYIVEEIIKAVLVFQLIDLKNKKYQLTITVFMGILFSLTETVFYFFNFFMLTSLAPLLERLVLTTLLHILTIVTILLPTWINKKLLPLGVIAAMIIHYIYNLFFL